MSISMSAIYTTFRCPIRVSIQYENDKALEHIPSDIFLIVGISSHDWKMFYTLWNRMWSSLSKRSCVSSFQVQGRKCRKELLLIGLKDDAYSNTYTRFYMLWVCKYVDSLMCQAPGSIYFLLSQIIWARKPTHTTSSLSGQQCSLI